MVGGVWCRVQCRAHCRSCVLVQYINQYRLGIVYRGVTVWPRWRSFRGKFLTFLQVFVDSLFIYWDSMWPIILWIPFENKAVLFKLLPQKETCIFKKNAILSFLSLNSKEIDELNVKEGVPQVYLMRNSFLFSHNQIGRKNYQVMASFKSKTI